MKRGGANLSLFVLSDSPFPASQGFSAFINSPHKKTESIQNTCLDFFSTKAHILN